MMHKYIKEVSYFLLSSTECFLLLILPCDSNISIVMKYSELSIINLKALSLYKTYTRSNIFITRFRQFLHLTSINDRW